VNVLAANLLFRYPIWQTPEMPHRRVYPYIGAGVGVERARLSGYATNHQETDYAPVIQGLVGIKLFLIKMPHFSLNGNGQPLGTHSTTMERRYHLDIMNSGPSLQTSQLEE
jgi:hypothetical protein